MSSVAPSPHPALQVNGFGLQLHQCSLVLTNGGLPLNQLTHERDQVIRTRPNCPRSGSQTVPAHAPARHVATLPQYPAQDYLAIHPSFPKAGGLKYRNPIAWPRREGSRFAAFPSRDTAARIMGVIAAGGSSCDTWRIVACQHTLWDQRSSAAPREALHGSGRTGSGDRGRTKHNRALGTRRGVHPAPCLSSGRARPVGGWACPSPGSRTPGARWRSSRQHARRS